MPAIRSGGGLDARLPVSNRRAGDWLGLAAAPTFAAMALVSGLSGGEAFCAASLDASPLNGMAAMYGLMSVFHLPPWLKRL